MDDAQAGWIALNSLPGIGPVLSHRLCQCFGSPAAAFQADLSSLLQCPGIGPELGRKIAGHPWRRAAEKEKEGCLRHQCRIITLAEEEYPESLRQIACPPPVLYLRGRLTPQDAASLAMVGSRKPSQYGLAASRELATGLAQAGVTVVSGLARGIDASAHAAALDAGGRTLAVLAHGLKHLYPREHRRLHDRIVGQGAVVTEFPLDMAPLAQNFPRRNRIISGLSRGVLVVEAGAASGALITARWAAEQGREVFAVPGGYNAALSKGAHSLIQDGAKLVTCLTDVLEEIGSLAGTPKRPEAAAAAPASRTSFTVLQEKILASLEGGSRHIDQLALAAGQPMSVLLGELLALELLGWVASSPGQWYQRTSQSQGGAEHG